MVALVIGGTLIVAIVQTLLRMEGSWDRSQERATTNQNTRGAVTMMVRDLRMAGTGFGGRMIVTGGIPGNVLFPVNPKADSVHSIKCYPSVGAVPDPIDLAGEFFRWEVATAVAGAGSYTCWNRRRTPATTRGSALVSR